MQILIDGRVLGKAGLGRYAQELVSTLISADGINEYRLLVNNEAQIVTEKNLGLKRLRINIPIYSLREQLWLPFQLISEKADLIHFPSFNIPVLCRRPFVVTIHDLVYFLFRDACPSAAAHQYAKFLISRGAKHSRQVITDSNYSKEDLIKHLGICADKISVIYPGVGHQFRIMDSTSQAEVRRKYGINRGYLLYVGNHHKRKNLARLIEAFSRIKNGKELCLVIAGKKTHHTVSLARLVKEKGLERDILFVGGVAESDLPALYSGAKIFIFPSLYEGFGLPPLEAMACGTPVITSNVTSLPEIVGDAAVLVDPLKVSELIGAIEEVLESSSLREQLRKRGRQRARLFSWPQTARQTIEVYKLAGGGAG